MRMVRVGCHVSIAGSIDESVSRAIERNCDTFQIFTRNPRGWKRKELEQTVVDAFIENVNASGIRPVVAHMPYLPNLASPDSEIYIKSLETLTNELKRCDLLDIPYLVTHLGSHRGAGLKKGISRQINGINQAFEASLGNVMLLLENTAGTKNSVGGSFEDIRTIMDGITDQKRVGICFDTCHGFAAGYEMRTEEGVSETLEHFDSIIGADYLKAVHLNDSRGELGSRIDRHEHIGMGYIGDEGFRHILHHPLIRALPLICETPVDKRRDDIGNISRVRELAV